MIADRHKPSTAKDAQGPRELIERHMKFFNLAASQQIAQDICAAPVQYTTRSGHAVAATTADVEHLFDAIFREISEQGWVR